MMILESVESGNVFLYYVIYQSHQIVAAGLQHMLRESTITKIVPEIGIEQLPISLSNPNSLEIQIFRKTQRLNLLTVVTEASGVPERIKTCRQDDFDEIAGQSSDRRWNTSRRYTVCEFG